ncbi:MAG: hypothetical protein ACM3ZQ_05260 [Bacillota bacterium]
MNTTHVKFTRYARDASLAFMLSIILMDLSYVVLFRASPPQQWEGVAKYSQTFRVSSMLPVFAGLAVVPTYMFLCRYWGSLTNGVGRAWTRIGIAFSYLFAIISGSAYLVQLLVVLPRAQSGRLEGLEALIFANDRSLAWAANYWGWFFLGISAFCFAQSLTWSGVDRVIKLLLWIYAASSILLVLGYMLQNLPLQLPMVICWFTVQPLAYSLLGVRFDRLLRPRI